MFLLILKRLGLGLITIMLVSIIIFVGVEVLPGDACTAFLEREAKGELLQICKEQLGLNTPAIERYLTWSYNALNGDLGYSLSGQKPISEILSIRIRNSLVLAFTAIIIGIPLALLLGIITALWRDKLPDIFISTFAIFSMTIPEFISATILILVVAIWLDWLPGIVIVSSNTSVLELLLSLIHI